ncbi:SDR family oxidoreductase [Nitrosarchaeum sp. AC2]|uniref:SDR family oxidoreductase n=1 Tax=Nitrosarchaeum sp. AC2 TaxID=2259673 RepID=UPI0015C7D582|nr:SDR family oxidoreductase [Nitrosarchaeum sp. AC2]QLH10223.1 short-chain dehydrogenase [Nitrosarchaeum sp. AC2]
MNVKCLFDLNGRVVLLTGAGGLLGEQYADGLSQAGAHVILADINYSKVKLIEKTLKLKYNTKPFAVKFDITDKKSIKKMIDLILRKYSKIDVLINNAVDQGNAKLRTTDFIDLPQSSWDNAIKINLTGMFLCCQEVGKVMLKQKKGVIINISSTYGLVAPDQRIYGKSGQNSAIFYAATKSAVLNFTRYLASYWHNKGIRVNTLTPGGVEKGQDPEFIKKYSKKTMLGRMAKKNEYVGAIIFLASDASSYMTGSNLIIDGGWTAW